MIDTAATSDGGQELVFLLDPLRRDQDLHRAAHYLGLMISEDTLGALVPARDDPAQVLAEDCVVGGIDDCPQELLRCWRFGGEGFACLVSVHGAVKGPKHRPARKMMVRQSFRTWGAKTRNHKHGPALGKRK